MSEHRDNSGSALDEDIASNPGDTPRYEVLSDGEITEKAAVKLASGAPSQKADGEWRRVPIPINWTDKARLFLEINRRATSARFRMIPPPEDHEETFNIGIFREMLDKCRIVYGLQPEAVQQIFADPPASLPYGEPVVVAVGVEAINGVDGVVTELFERVLQPRPEERPDGSVDFKNLNLIQNVTKGTVICEISNPIQGTPGTNVHGKPIRPVPARAPLIPRGEHVELVDLDENHSQLVASIEGNLIYRNQRFNIDSVYTVQGNIDISTGNIEFSGDVVVKGDVYEGFSIKTDRDVIIHGMVEGASIYAGGNIEIHRGMNGMSKGVIEAKGSIAAKFLENCTVIAGGDVTAEEIINCTVETDGGITLAGRGKLVGGHITSFGSISAKTVGSRSSTPIQITLGVTPQMVHKRERAKEQYKEVLAELDSLTRDVIFLEQPKYTESFEHQKKLDDYRGKLNLANFKKKRLENKLRQLTKEQEEVPPSSLTCTTVHPPFRISIGGETLVLHDSADMCRFYINEAGELTMGVL